MESARKIVCTICCEYVTYFVCKYCNAYCILTVGSHLKLVLKESQKLFALIFHIQLHDVQQNHKSYRPSIPSPKVIRFLVLHSSRPQVHV